MKTRLCVLAVVALSIWALKRHYADARADDLWWILAPTTAVVSQATHTQFTRISGEGYFAQERLFLVEKSCAGVNFMIAAFAVVMFVLFRHVRSWHSAGAVFVTSLIASYCAAVLVNATRIALAMWLAADGPALRITNAAQAHRVEGIVVYFGGLVLLHELARHVDRRAARVERTP